MIRPRGREGLGTRLPQVPPYQLVIRTILPLKETATPNTGEFKPNVIQLEAQKGFSVPRLSKFRSLTVDKKNGWEEAGGPRNIYHVSVYLGGQWEGEEPLTKGQS